MKRVISAAVSLLFLCTVLSGCRIESVSRHAARVSSEMSGIQSASSAESGSAEASSAVPGASSTVSSAKGAAAGSPSAAGTVSKAGPEKKTETAVSSGPRVTISIDCTNALNWYRNNGKAMDPDVIPANGVILPKTIVPLKQGDTVYSVLNRVMEGKIDALYDGSYIIGIHNLYAGTVGNAEEKKDSGWMYSVNGKYPGACNQYVLKTGDLIAWRFTCNSGNDLPKDGAG